MELHKQTWEKSDGTTGYTYSVKKLDETGQGLKVNQKITIECDFAPEFKTIEYTDKKTKQKKSFQSVKILGKLIEAPEDVDNYEVHEEYQNAQFQLPSSVRGDLIDARVGDQVTLWLEPFNFTNRDGEEIKGTKWKVAINGEETESKKTSSQQTIEQTTKKPTLKVNTPTKTVSKEAYVPEELRGEWLSNVVKLKGEFYENFTDEDILAGKVEPSAFLEWLDDAESCGTDFFTEQHEAGLEMKPMKIKCFWGIIEEMK
jgi:hypothetical protein